MKHWFSQYQAFQRRANRAKMGQWLVGSVFTLLPFAVYAANAVSSPVVDTQSIERGKQTATVCAACHMPDGRGSIVPNVEARPRLTGLNPEYFVKQLHNFKDGMRENASMKPMATMLDDKQMQDVAHYFASLPIVHDAPPEADPEQLKLGERLVSKGDWDRFIPACSNCHGLGAMGVGTHFPNLRGQSAEYIAQQLHAWKKGTRHNDLLGLMKPIADRLTEAEIQAVSAWLAHQDAVPAVSAPVSKETQSTK